MGIPGGSYGKESTSNAGDLGLVPKSGRSPGEENGSSILAWRIPWAGSLQGYSPRGCKELDNTEQLTLYSI